MCPHSSQRGMTLIAALLLLVVVTILGLGMFHSFGIQERIAGNTREKQRGLRAAESTQAQVELLLTANQGANATIGSTCSPGLVTTLQICTNTLASVATNLPNLPLNIGGVETGVTYAPPGVTAASNTANTYYQIPRYYVSFISGSYNQTTGAATNSYTIDAVGYGGTANSIAEVESTYVVNVLYTTSSGKSKFINLGGP